MKLARADPEPPPEYVYVTRCPLCGGGAPHDKAECVEKMRDWKPVGILAALAPWMPKAGPEAPQN